MIDTQLTAALPSPARPAGAGSGLVPNPNAELTKTDFLTLMITQLRTQDPLNPLDQNQFLAQTAQFASLEQLVAMNETLGRLATGLSAAPEPSASLAQLQQIARALEEIKGLLGGSTPAAAPGAETGPPAGGEAPAVAGSPAAAAS
jgi:flagellar hook assembly protein FlgD